VKFLPEYVGLGHWSIWIIAASAAVLMGAIVGAIQGWVIGYLVIPSFIVTLGGLLIFRGAMWWVTQGQTVAPLDPNFRLLGGGADGTLGETLSWAFGLFASFAAVTVMLLSRRRKEKHGLYHGVAIPVVILLIVTVGMTLVASRTRFGRYVYATGGNPEAAELSGINTRLLTVKVFALMGALTGLSAAVASARLGAVDVGLGTLDELKVIAAAVIGGTALAGGSGTIYGAVIGALVMQTLQSGMASANVDAPLQNIVVGFVLVFAVWVDIIYRRKTGV